MTFEERLRRMRTGCPPAPTGGSSPSKLGFAERIERIRGPGRTHDRSGIVTTRQLAEVLGARQLAPGVLLIEQRLAAASLHGKVRLDGCIDAVKALRHTDDVDPGRWMFLDTETSGLAGGTGTWVFLVGCLTIDKVASDTGEPIEFVLHQYLLTRLDAEAAYLDALRCEFERSELMLSYNGKTFDLPLLASRFRLAGQSLSVSAIAHLDLLFYTRRAFSGIWPNCRLATAETNLLDLVRNDDLPGSEAPGAWLGWLRRGETGRLAAVVRHNRYDVLSLAALTTPLAASFADPITTGAHVLSIARYHRVRGEPEQALAILARHRDALAAPELFELAGLMRARGAWEDAAEIWSQLAERDQPEALEALSKYCEHRIGDHARALELARRLPDGPNRERRMKRLEARLGVYLDSTTLPSGSP